MSNELGSYTEEDLLAELKSRAEAREAFAKAERLAQCKMVLKHRDVLREFMTHGRISCNKVSNAHYHPEHGGAGCNLCCLNDLYERDDIEIDVQVQFRSVNSVKKN